MGEVGRPTDLTDELVKEIKKHILAGNNLKETANLCGIDEQKLYNWHYDNYLNISDKIDGWRRDRKLNLAEGVIEDMLTMPVTVLEWQGKGDDAEQVVVTSPALVKVKQDTAKFVGETLGRNNYSKRTETDLTSKGEALQPLLVKFLDDKSDSNSGDTDGVSETI